MAGVVQYATGGLGPYINDIGWFDFTGVTLVAGSSILFSNTVPNMGNIVMFIINRAEFLTAGGYGGPAGEPFQAAYSGVGGNPSLISDKSTSDFYIEPNFNYSPGNSYQNTPYSLIFCDGGETLLGQTSQWIISTSGVWNLLADIPSGGVDVITGNGTNTITSTGTESGSGYNTPVAASLTAYFAAKTLATTLGIFFNRIITSIEVNTDHAKLGSILTYTIPILSYTTDTLTNVYITNNLPTSLQFVPGSVVINGIPNLLATIPTISLPNMGMLNTVTVSFNAIVNTITSSSVTNKATVFGTLSSAQTFANMSTITNSVTTSTLYANLTATKSVAPLAAVASSTLTYTIVLKNIGNITANNISMMDTTPASTTYIAGSLTGGFGSPDSGIDILDIPSGGTSTITFQVLIDSIPANYVTNDSTTTYSYVYDPTTPASATDAVTSNTVTIEVGSANIESLTNYVSNSYGTIGSILSYTFVFTNSGNMTATNVLFTDPLPNGTSFIPNSLIFNGVTLTNSSPDIPGVTLPNILAGQVSTLTFNIVVTTLPTPNPLENGGFLSYTFSLVTIPTTVLSNIQPTTINYVTLTASKSVNKVYANIGDILTYTIPITNNGNVPAENVVFIDTVPSGITLVPDSLYQDGTPVFGSSNPPGITLPNSISPFSTSYVVFQVQITTLPSPNPITNNASVSAIYTIDPETLPNIIGTVGANTATVSTKVNTASLSGITKYSSKSYVTCGDLLTYTIVVPNTGNTTALNVVLVDTLPSQAIFQNNSVTVNSIPQFNTFPTSGITIPSISPGAVATVTFTVQVQCNIT